MMTILKTSLVWAKSKKVLRHLITRCQIGTSSRSERSIVLPKRFGFGLSFWNTVSGLLYLKEMCYFYQIKKSFNGYWNSQSNKLHALFFCELWTPLPRLVNVLIFAKIEFKGGEILQITARHVGQI